MYKKGVILLNALLIIPSISNVSVTAINNNQLIESKSVEGSNFKFDYKTYLKEEIKDVPFLKEDTITHVNNVCVLSYRFNYPKINYKDLFIQNIIDNHSELIEYKKELLYFVEISGNYQDELTFRDPTRYNVDILVDIDGVTNKFGYYLMTFNSYKIYKKNMVVDFLIDNKTYNFEFEYSDYEGIYLTLNYFESLKEVEEFITRYGL